MFFFLYIYFRFSPIALIYSAFVSSLLLIIFASQAFCLLPIVCVTSLMIHDGLLIVLRVLDGCLLQNHWFCFWNFQIHVQHQFYQSVVQSRVEGQVRRAKNRNLLIWSCNYIYLWIYFNLCLEWKIILDNNIIFIISNYFSRLMFMVIQSKNSTWIFILTLVNFRNVLITFKMRNSKKVMLVLSKDDKWSKSVWIVIILFIANML